MSADRSDWFTATATATETNEQKERVTGIAKGTAAQATGAGLLPVVGVV